MELNYHLDWFMVTFHIYLAIYTEVVKTHHDFIFIFFYQNC